MVPNFFVKFSKKKSVFVCGVLSAYSYEFFVLV